MEYRRLGRTALRVSPICLGTMNFGPLTSEPDSFEIMDRALEHGINFFDTANRYGGDKGPGATEAIVGRWFAQGGDRREKVVLEEWTAADRAGERYFPHEFMYKILRSGKLKKSYQIDPKHSWMLAACEKNLPIVVPGPFGPP